MKNIFIAAAALICSFACAMEMAPVPKFEEAAAFYISFDDETMNADISLGKEKPVSYFGSRQGIFMPGVRGKALYCGDKGTKIRFERSRNLNFDKSGTIVFFYKGDFKKTESGPRVFLWGIESQKGYVGLQLANDPKTLCPCKRDLHIMFLNGKRIANKVFSTQLSGGEAGCEKWHMLAFSWAPGQLSVKYDNDPVKNFPVSFDMTEADFPGNDFSIGSNVHWNYYLDEFAIYNRRLSDSELSEIYQHYIK